MLSLSLAHVESSRLKTLERSLESSVNEFGPTLVGRVWLLDSNKLNPGAHVSHLCPDSSLVKNTLVVEINLNGHVEQMTLLKVKKLPVVSVEYNDEGYHVESYEAER